MQAALPPAWGWAGDGARFRGRREANERCAGNETQRPPHHAGLCGQEVTPLLGFGEELDSGFLPGSLGL